MSDTKKDVCRALTNVVRNSPLVDRIDPKSFYVMLNTNFSVLYRDGSLDLVPVWDALATGEVPPALYGLFLAFQNTAYSRGFSVVLPPAVEALSPDQRANYMALVQPANGHAGSNGTTGELPPSVVEMNDDEFYRTDPNAQGMQLALGTGDLKPFVPDELRREIVQDVVASLRTAPVGERLDTAQLAYLVDSNFDDLCDGQKFDFAPVLGGLRQLEGVTDADIYAGVVALEQALIARNITLEPLHMDVDREFAARLVAEAEKRAREKAEQAALEARARARTASPSPELKVPPPSSTPSEPLEAPTKIEKQEQRLRRWGVRMLSARQKKAIRYGILVFGLLMVTSLGYFYRLDRNVDVSIFAPDFPMKSAEIKDGVFFGIVDDSKWWAVHPTHRQKRIERMQKIMHAKGWVPNAQIRDLKGRLVITGMGGKKLSVARYFSLGSADGTIPESARQVIPANAPPEARAAMRAQQDKEKDDKKKAP